MLQTKGFNHEVLWERKKLSDRDILYSYTLVDSFLIYSNIICTSCCEKLTKPVESADEGLLHSVSFLSVDHKSSFVKSFFKMLNYS